MRRAAAALAALVLLAGCGGDDGAGQLRVSAAASLKGPLPGYKAAAYSFAGSDELAAQIRSGARPDVYVAANTDLPDALHDEGLVDRPVTFASNRLVVAVPRGSASGRSLADLSRRGVRLAVGAPSVPVGAYTREVLARLGPAQEKAILANVRSNEPDVSGVVGKVAQDAVDAGFVYATDVRASDDRLVAIDLPSRLQPGVNYAAAVVRGTDRADAAEAFVAGLAGAPSLREAGFEPARP